jgi:hypothetical protein
MNRIHFLVFHTCKNHPDQYISFLLSVCYHIAIIGIVFASSINMEGGCGMHGCFSLRHEAGGHHSDKRRESLGKMMRNLISPHSAFSNLEKGGDLGGKTIKKKKGERGCQSSGKTKRPGGSLTDVSQLEKEKNGGV